MPEEQEDKPSPLNIFMALVNGVSGDVGYDEQELNEIIEKGKALIDKIENDKKGLKNNV